MADFRVRPSRRLRQEIAARGSTNAAAREFGIEPGTLFRFLDAPDKSISGQTIAALIEGTGLGYDVLFEHQEVK